MSGQMYVTGSRTPITNTNTAAPAEPEPAWVAQYEADNAARLDDLRTTQEAIRGLEKQLKELRADRLGIVRHCIGHGHRVQDLADEMRVSKQIVHRWLRGEKEADQ